MFFQKALIINNSYRYLWKDQIKKWTPRSITASTKDFLDNMKEQKLHSEEKLESITVRSEIIKVSVYMSVYVCCRFDIFHPPDILPESICKGALFN